MFFSAEEGLKLIEQPRLRIVWQYIEENAPVDDSRTLLRHATNVHDGSRRFTERCNRNLLKELWKAKEQICLLFSLTLFLRFSSAAFGGQATTSDWYNI